MAKALLALLERLMDREQFEQVDLKLAERDIVFGIERVDWKTRFELGFRSCQ